MVPYGVGAVVAVTVMHALLFLDRLSFKEKDYLILMDYYSTCFPILNLLL